MTTGDAINTCPVSYISPTAWGRGDVEIEIVQLTLIDPSTLDPDLAKRALSGSSTEAILKHKENISDKL